MLQVWCPHHRPLDTHHKLSLLEKKKLKIIGHHTHKAQLNNVRN